MKKSYVTIEQLWEPLLGYTYAKSGDREKALQSIQDFEKQTQSIIRKLYAKAMVYAGLGDLDTVFELFEKITDRSPFYLLVMCPWPEWKMVCSDPRYQELLKKTGLPK